MATWETVREIAAGLPEAEESTSYDTPAFKVRGKLFARLRDDGDTVAVRVDRLEREALVETYPAVFFVTPHYQNYPYVLLRLSAAEREQLEDALVESWCLAAPRRLVNAFVPEGLRKAYAASRSSSTPDRSSRQSSV